MHQIQQFKRRKYISHSYWENNDTYNLIETKETRGKFLIKANWCNCILHWYCDYNGSFCCRTLLTQKDRHFVSVPL